MVRILSNFSINFYIHFWKEGLVRQLVAARENSVSKAPPLVLARFINLCPSCLAKPREDWGEWMQEESANT